MAFFPQCFTINSFTINATFTHTNGDRMQNKARHRPVCQEQSGVQCLAQGHVDTPRAGDRTDKLPTARRPLLCPELMSPPCVSECECMSECECVCVCVCVSECECVC